MPTYPYPNRSTEDKIRGPKSLLRQGNRKNTLQIEMVPSGPCCDVLDAKICCTNSHRTSCHPTPTHVPHLCLPSKLCCYCLVAPLRPAPAIPDHVDSGSESNISIDTGLGSLTPQNSVSRPSQCLSISSRRGRARRLARLLACITRGGGGGWSKQSWSGDTLANSL